jgi:hypothetical protein
MHRNFSVVSNCGIFCATHMRSMTSCAKASRARWPGEPQIKCATLFDGWISLPFLFEPTKPFISLLTIFMCAITECPFDVCMLLRAILRFQNDGASSRYISYLGVTGLLKLEMAQLVPQWPLLIILRGNINSNYRLLWGSVQQTFRKFGPSRTFVSHQLSS